MHFVFGCRMTLSDKITELRKLELINHIPLKFYLKEDVKEAIKELKDGFEGDDYEFLDELTIPNLKKLMTFVEKVFGKELCE